MTSPQLESSAPSSVEERRQAKVAVRERKNRRERLFLLVTVALVLVAWVYGYFTSGADIAPLVPQVLPGVTSVTTQGTLFVGRDDTGNVMGYAAIAEAPGYGGPIEMLVGVDPNGNITGAQIVAQRESPGFFRLVTRSGLVPGYTGRAMTDPLRLGDDLNAVSGATMSAEGVATAVRTAVRDVAASALDTPLPAEDRPIRFGAPEIVLLLLFAAAYFGHRMRWGTLLVGLIFIGFLYTAPLTITMVVSLLSGYWPDWHNNLYWYLLIGGILFVTTVDAKNPYCTWFCPFGAFQECLGAITRAKVYRPRRWAEALTWLQRGLALAAIVLGLALRRPGVAGYEPFGTLFNLQGGLVAWALLILIILASLIISRPFCNYLCPVDPVVDFIAAGRRWTKELWTSWRAKPANS